MNERELAPTSKYNQLKTKSCRVHKKGTAFIERTYGSKQVIFTRNFSFKTRSS